METYVGLANSYTFLKKVTKHPLPVDICLLCLRDMFSPPGYEKVTVFFFLTRLRNGDQSISIVFAKGNVDILFYHLHLMYSREDTGLRLTYNVH